MTGAMEAAKEMKFGTKVA